MQTNKAGARIRAFREKQELTRQDLSERTGLSETFIAAVEDEDLYPSLGPLLKIARALGVRLGTFLDDQVSRDPLVVRTGERSEELTMHKAGDKPAALKFHSLGKGKSDRHMEPFFIELAPEPEEDKKLSSHEGEEFIVVTKGRISILYGAETHELDAGYSIYFNSVVPLFFFNDTATTEIYTVLYFPE